MKVGDRVKIRKDLDQCSYYGGCCFDSEMSKYRGVKTEIEAVESENRYRLKGCGYWHFTKEMFEPVESKFRIGDRVEMVDDFSPLKKGDKGTVKGFDAKYILVKWDRRLSPYYVEDGYGHYVPENQIKLVDSALTTGQIKAYELMKLAVENPGEYKRRKYKVVDGAYTCEGNAVPELYIGTDGDFRSEYSGYRVFIGYDTKLEEIPPEPKSVTFMEAAKAYSEGKTVVVEHKGHKHFYKASETVFFEHAFEDEMGISPDVHEILHGIWTVEG